MKLTDDLDFCVKMEYVHTPGFHYKSKSKAGIPLHYTEQAMRDLADTLTDDDQLVQFYVYPTNDMVEDDDDE